jgi:hypothetical protein
MIQAKKPRVLCGALAIAWLLGAPSWFASGAWARPKAAKRAASSSSAPAERTSDAPATPTEAEPSSAAPLAPPPAAGGDDKPKLQVTPVAAAPATPAASNSAATHAGSEAPSSNAASQASAAAANEKLAALRADVSSLTDDLVEARSRAAMLGKTLFKTQVRVRLQNLAAPDPVLVKVVLKLDGAPIYRTDGASLTGDEARQVFQGFIAPGAHVLSAEIEQRSRDDAAYGYVLHDTYRFQALREKRSELTLILDDDSDLASEFPDDSEGEYDVRVKLRVRTQALTER